MKKSALVIHSGGMDSSLCLALAIREFGVDQVLSVSFSYQQRHSNELIQAEKICKDWGVDHVVLSVDCLKQITDNALINREIPILQQEGKPPNTLVVGRNGLMVRIAAIHAQNLGAHFVYTGVIELDQWNSGYRDCSRDYMDLMQQILRIDLDDAAFEVRTPLVFMTKVETLELAESLGILDYLLKETISCYEGISGSGCKKCPACLLRNEGVRQYREKRR